MRRVMGLLLVVGLWGCEDTRGHYTGIVEKLRYVKDHRTGLCFATKSIPYQGYLAQVPCERVEKFLMNPRSYGREE